MDNPANPQGDRPELSRSFVLRYGCAVASLALAICTRLLLDPVLGDQFPFATLFFAVLVAVWYGGRRSALVTVVLGAIAADYFVVPPRGSFKLESTTQLVGMALYAAVGIGVALLGGVMHAAPLRSLRNLRQAREALAQAEERLRLTLRSSGVGLWSWDVAPNLIEADENCEALFGLSGGIQTDFGTLAPKIGQGFFIGDGLTGAGTGSQVSQSGSSISRTSWPPTSLAVLPEGNSAPARELWKT